MTTEDQIRAFIVDELNFAGDPSLLTSDYPLLESDTIDSMGIFTLVQFCENELGVHIPDEDLLPENFSTLGRISALIDDKRSN